MTRHRLTQAYLDGLHTAPAEGAVNPYLGEGVAVPLSGWGARLWLRGYQARMRQDYESYRRYIDARKALSRRRPRCQRLICCDRCRT